MHEARTGLTGDQFTYIADNPTKDFGGPKARGWRTIRIRRPASLHAGLASGEDVDAEITSLDELRPSPNSSAGPGGPADGVRYVSPPRIRDRPHRSGPRIGIRSIVVDGPVGTAPAAGGAELPPGARPDAGHCREMRVLDDADHQAAGRHGGREP